MLVQRINRMVLGVASPVSRFVTALTGGVPIEVDEPEAIEPASDLLVVGRQQHLPDGALRLGADVIEAGVARLPHRIVYVLPDRFSDARYARDQRAWREVAARGHRVMVLELAALRELGDDVAVARARPILDDSTAAVVALLDGRSLG